MQTYLDTLLSKNDGPMIKAEQRGLKRSHHSLQREIGRFLFYEYQSFLSASDTLETLTYQVEDARASLAHHGMIMQALKGQIDRVQETDALWKEVITSEEAIANEAKDVNRQDVVQQVEEALDVAEQAA